MQGIITEDTRENSNRVTEGIANGPVFNLAMAASVPLNSLCFGNHMDYIPEYRSSTSRDGPHLACLVVPFLMEFSHGIGSSRWRSLRFRLRSWSPKRLRHGRISWRISCMYLTRVLVVQSRTPSCPMACHVLATLLQRMEGEHPLVSWVLHSRGGSEDRDARPVATRRWAKRCCHDHH